MPHSSFVERPASFDKRQHILSKSCPNGVNIFTSSKAVLQNLPRCIAQSPGCCRKTYLVVKHTERIAATICRTAHFVERPASFDKRISSHVTKFGQHYRSN
jgi:hypothetical protein